jgi:glycosyltransferase involved in cell wall biosynthesis
MDYYPNERGMTEFCAEVLPLLRDRRPSIKLLIVGADPSPAVRRLGELPGVTVTGSVPQVQPYVLRSALSVTPLHIARGTQNKMLESMAMGVPVVSSRIAAGGVDAVAGEHLLIATSPTEYRDAILRILDDPVERARLAVAGRARVLSHHAWPSSMLRMDRIIERCIEAFANKDRSKVVTERQMI